MTGVSSSISALSQFYNSETQRPKREDAFKNQDRLRLESLLIHVACLSPVSVRGRRKTSSEKVGNRLLSFSAIWVKEQARRGMSAFNLVTSNHLFWDRCS
ncbi:predicted protein [Histoplasma capsulatum H143]|uniref:Uncharacterized protein n=1 Tax=Ajellomyces capsulatus (strain H143) TaxID=544712 RepID=C6HNH8_AJECH|nr:predicted protein [Histoplasma capsulatum H143]